MTSPRGEFREWKFFVRAWWKNTDSGWADYRVYFQSMLRVELRVFPSENWSYPGGLRFAVQFCEKGVGSGQLCSFYLGAKLNII